MKQLYLAILFYGVTLNVYSQAAPTGYCASQPSTDNYSEITNVSVGALNNNTNCMSLTGSQGTATGTVDFYSNFTGSSVPVPLITPGAALNVSATITGCDWGNTSFYTGYGKYWIDLNRDGTFNTTNEEFVLGSEPTTSFAAPYTRTYNTTASIPSNISLGYTRMRVSWRMFGQSLANITPCGNVGNGTTTWGETEDYIVLLGAKKWDYSMDNMLAPDSISFCAQDPVVIKAAFTNTGNQPLPGGRVDLYIQGVEPGSTTNLFQNKTWTQTIGAGQASTVDFNPIMFPKDELVKMTYIIVFPLDSNKSNDTLIKYVQVYKNPVYKLKANEVCADSFSTVMIYDKPLHLFHKWSNESIVDTTTFKLPSSGSVGIQVSRGWKCNVTDVLPIVVNPLPKLIMARDTILCNGQSAKLEVSMNMSGSWSWEETNNPEIPAANQDKYYVAKGESTKGCETKDSTKVTVVFPPAQPKVLDTVCANEQATIGLDYTGTEFLYKWTGRTETTPLINPIPTVPSGTEKYNVQWWYRGCTSRDSVVLRVNPLPNVTLNSAPPICPYFSSTITASGAQTYTWRNGLGTGATKIVSPMTTTDYYVKGTDQNQCSKEILHRQFVHPMPDMKVYSNKWKDNVCFGDSATVYVNGGKTYNWSTGVTDSVIKIVPSESFQWSMIGTDGNGCKDTLTYRMNVKPAFSISYDKTLKGCEGDKVKLTASGAKEYDWGEGPTNDSFSKELTLINSTSYQVTATSPHDCQIVASIPVTVWEKPVGQVSDLTVCKGDVGKLEAKGGDRFDWEINGQTSVSGTSNVSSYSGSASEQISVEVTNAAGCKDTAWTTVNVINTDDAVVVFKSPLDSYNCASPKIPITLSATPVGGVWSGGSYVTGNKLSPAGLNGTVQVLYTYFEPINNCKVERIKTVKFKCTSGISGLDNNYDDFAVYPMPFTDKITVKFTSDKAEEANMYIYDLSGREVYHHTHRLLPGENLIDLNQLQLSKGTYYLDFQTESVSRQAKMMAQ